MTFDGLGHQPQTSNFYLNLLWTYFILPFNCKEWPRQNFSLQYQHRIKQASEEKKEESQLGDYKLIQYQILQIEIISILWQTVGRITNEMLGVKGLIINHGSLKV